ASDAAQSAWPDYAADGARIRSTFQFDGKQYLVNLSASAVNDQQNLPADAAESPFSHAVLPTQTKRPTPQQQLALNTLRCLMDELAPAHEVAVNDSYELVERTIDEIYAARSIVERTRERMNQSMARLQDTVVVADIAGKIIFINDVGDDYFEPGLTGATIFSLQNHLARAVWLAMLRDVMLLDKPIYQEVETVAGKLLLCQAAKLHEQDAARDTLLFVFTDVTQLRALEQSKNEALAFLSHDMRSPLVSQLALIEKFRLSSPEQAQAQQALLQKLVYFAERSLKYSEDFLQLSRAENLDQQAFQLVDMHGVIDGAYSQVTGLALKHEVPIEIVRANEDCWMQGDAQLLERAVTNLLSNAIQHSPAGRKVTLSLQAGEQLQVSIADCGRGIEDAAIPHLFEPYFRARQKQGTGANTLQPAAEEVEMGARNYGLGLSFVHSVVERHGGRIDVRSKLGHGTTFTLFFRKTELE
ncbi:MAG: HAMP domain-containing histidine kinase, partial [Gammaproteobacteria bacterium]|nr:HAMP domain-containing histidine kinase [Gammaproteobacteria bacterium]